MAHDAGAMVPASGAIRSGAASKVSEPVSRLELVNVLQGTASTRAFSRGNTLPIAAVPFGMAHCTMQSNASTSRMFQPGERRFQGFRCTHQLSPWLADYGYAIFLPFCGNVNPDPELRSSSWRPEDAKLLPHSFRLSLSRYDADTELIPKEIARGGQLMFSMSAVPTRANAKRQG
jgi:putative alpha-1,2-mannosidase